MDIIGIMATDLNLVGKLIYNVLYKWVENWGSGYELLGAFSITVILFTIFLKAATSPFDVWQKVVTRKNARIMETMKPEIDKVTKQCGNNRELLMQKQRAIYKAHKYSTFASCLPMLITLVIFFVVFSGFNSAVKYYNSVTFDELKVVYNNAYTEKTEEFIASGKAVYQTVEGVETLVPAEGYTAPQLKAEQIKAAEDAVVSVYSPEKFLLTKNIFMPDTWSDPVPDAETFTGTGMGKLGITGIDGNEYNKVMKPVMEKYNTENGSNVWNGYLILPILAFLLNIAGLKLNKPPEQPEMIGQTEEQKKAQKAQSKMMTYMMPVLMAVFAFLYSTAFTLYMFINSLITTLFNLIYNIVAKKKDAKEREYRLSTTLKK